MITIVNAVNRFLLVLGAGYTVNPLLLDGVPENQVTASKLNA